MLGYFQKFSYEHGPDGCADTCMLHVTTDDAHQPYILLNFLSLQPGTQGITSACKTEAYIAPEFLLLACMDIARPVLPVLQLLAVLEQSPMKSSSDQQAQPMILYKHVDCM